LSKSIQFGSLASNQLEDETLVVPPKALEFFFGDIGAEAAEAAASTVGHDQQTKMRGTLRAYLKVTIHFSGWKG